MSTEEKAEYLVNHGGFEHSGDASRLKELGVPDDLINQAIAAEEGKIKIDMLKSSIAKKAGSTSKLQGKQGDLNEIMLIAIGKQTIANAKAKTVADINAAALEIAPFFDQLFVGLADGSIKFVHQAKGLTPSDVFLESAATYTVIAEEFEKLRDPEE